MTASIQFGYKKIDFLVLYSMRKTLGIALTTEIDVKVKASVGSTIEKIKEKLRKKASWIIKQQGFFLASHPKATERKYINVETHLYLVNNTCSR
jgi:hypothetical protein